MPRTSYGTRFKPEVLEKVRKAAEYDNRYVNQLIEMAVEQKADEIIERYERQKRLKLAY